MWFLFGNAYLGDGRRKKNDASKGGKSRNTRSVLYMLYTYLVLRTCDDAGLWIPSIDSCLQTTRKEILEVTQN